MTFKPVRPSEKIATRLLYLEDQDSLVGTATILDFSERDSSWVVVVDRTPMYVKRGGQPSDRGGISGPGFSIAIHSVTLNGKGQAEHMGDLSGRKPVLGEAVDIVVDADVRRLHSLWHSAGEAIIVAAKMAGFDAPVCGAIHYGPNQNRIEYQIKLDKDEANQLHSNIQSNLVRLIGDDTPITSIDLTDKQDIMAHCGFWPDYLTMGQIVRVIRVRPDCTGRPCTGTHLSRTSELGHVEVGKVKVRGDKTIVSYDCYEGYSAARNVMRSLSAPCGVST